MKKALSIVLAVMACVTSWLFIFGFWIRPYFITSIEFHIPDGYTGLFAVYEVSEGGQTAGNLRYKKKLRVPENRLLEVADIGGILTRGSMFKSMSGFYEDGTKLEWHQTQHGSSGQFGLWQYGTSWRNLGSGNSTADPASDHKAIGMFYVGTWEEAREAENEVEEFRNMIYKSKERNQIASSSAAHD